MITREVERFEDRRDALPAWVDLSVAVDSATLLSWIETEVAMLSWNTTEQYERAPAAGAVGIDFRTLLHLLCFSYATGLYSSDDIIRACRTNPVVRDICRGIIPFSQELQSVRRRHRLLLEKVLAAVILRVALSRPGARPEPCLTRNVVAGAAERLNVARHLDSSLD